MHARWDRNFVCNGTLPALVRAIYRVTVDSDYKPVVPYGCCTATSRVTVGIDYKLVVLYACSCAYFEALDLDAVYTGFHGHFHTVPCEPNSVANVCTSVGVDSLRAALFTFTFAALV